jgi:hypothetical protein
MFESLEEGIMLLKENEISFSNSIFDQILNKPIMENSDQTLDQKIFKVFR